MSQIPSDRAHVLLRATYISSSGMETKQRTNAGLSSVPSFPGPPQRRAQDWAVPGPHGCEDVTEHPAFFPSPSSDVNLHIPCRQKTKQPFLEPHAAERNSISGSTKVTPVQPLPERRRQSRASPSARPPEHRERHRQ